MKLYLVQHGDAVSKDINSERPLSDMGKQDIARLASLIKHAAIRVERVVHSGKLRAQQTAEQLATVMAPGVSLATSEQMHPNDEVKNFDWHSLSGGQDLLLVGHLPFMAKLVSHLLSGAENTLLVAFQPGTMVCLELLQDSSWQINWMIRPECLQ